MTELEWVRTPSGDRPVIEKRIRYRARPLTVDAIKYDGKNMMALHEFGVPFTGSAGGALSIVTKEGPMQVSVGDWVIREPFPTGDRDFYPVKPDIFENRYDPVEVKMVPPDRMISSLFSGDLDPVRGDSIRIMYPLVEAEEVVDAPSTSIPQTSEHVEQLDQDELRWIENLLKVAARDGYFEGADDLHKKVGRMMTDAPSGRLRCEECNLPLWIVEDESGCANPRCPDYKAMPRRADGLPWPS